MRSSSHFYGVAPEGRIASPSFSYIVIFFPDVADSFLTAPRNMVGILIFYAAFFPLGASAQGITGIVSSVYDGNTVELQADDRNHYRIILFGIDCPELSQPYGEESKAFVESRLLNRKVEVQFHGKDRHGNYIGVIKTENSDDVRELLLAAGLAWTGERNPAPELESLRKGAVSGSRGLWQDDAPVPPWTYRRNQTMLQPKSR